MNDHHRVHQNEYGQMVGSSVQLKPIHFLADSLSGTHASLQVLSTDTLTPACLKQLWQVLKDEAMVVVGLICLILLLKVQRR